jgi:hypothetical protein
MREGEAGARELFGFLEDEFGFELWRVDATDGAFTLVYKNRDRGLAFAVGVDPRWGAGANAGRLDAAGRLRPFGRDGFEVGDWWTVARGDLEQIADTLRRHPEKLERARA